MSTTAILFAGQGAQHVGMGKDIADAFPAAREVYRQADDLLGMHLADLCFNGPADKLNATDISQPAIFTTSVAIFRALAPSGLAPAAAAGLSLGEHTALWLADSVSFDDALRLVRRRGQLMQAACEAQPGTMVSVIGLDEQQVNDLCRQASAQGAVVPANFNCPGQIVVSGSKSGCNRILELVEQQGGRALPLSVAGAFHSPLMQSAADGLTECLADTTFKQPRFPVPANVDGQYHVDQTSIRDALYRQVIQPVRWQQCVQTLMADGFDSFVEIGPGRVLTGLMRRINRHMKVRNVSSVKDLST